VNKTSKRLIKEWNKIVAFQVYFEKTVLTIPGNAMYITNGFEMLESIYKKEFGKIRAFKKHQKDFRNKDTQIDFLVNIHSYVIILCSLEQIIKKTFDDMIVIVKDITGIILPEQKNEKVKRQEEIKDWIHWRNKVFAHTAYVKPQKDDNISMQLTSIFLGFGGGMGIGKNSYQLGGLAQVVEGHPAPKLSKIDILESHQKVIEHFTNWKLMFDKIVGNLNSYNEKEIVKSNHLLKEKQKITKWIKPQKK